MKKVMLFIASMLFAVAANAATLHIDGGVSTPHPQDATVVSQNGNDATAFTEFLISTSDTTPVTVNVGGFEPSENLVSMDVSIDGASAVTITEETVFSAFITAGLTNKLSILVSNIVLAGEATFVNYSVSASAVPVPAALFLFAPALLGFLGLRRKATLAA